MAGRFYLQSYYAVFDVQFSDLGLSPQDVMFNSWKTLLLPLVTAAVSLPAVLHLTQTGESIKSLRSRLREIHERSVQGDSVEDALSELERDTDAVERSMGWMRNIGALGRVLPLRVAGEHPVPSAVVVIASGFSILVLIDSAIEGWRPALFDASGPTLMGIVGLGNYWLMTFASEKTWSMRRVTFVTALMALALVTVLPAALGALDGHGVAANDGAGLPAIALISDRCLAPDWSTVVDGCASPKVRLIAEGNSFVSVWSTSAPHLTTMFPVGEIKRIERRRS